jgi:hypothetical protein
MFQAGLVRIQTVMGVTLGPEGLEGVTLGWARRGVVRRRTAVRRGRRVRTMGLLFLFLLQEGRVVVHDIVEDLGPVGFGSPEGCRETETVGDGDGQGVLLQSGAERVEGPGPGAEGTLIFQCRGFSTTREGEEQVLYLVGGVRRPHQNHLVGRGGLLHHGRGSMDALPVEVPNDEDEEE